LFLSSLYQTLAEVFPEVVVLPGPNNIFIATSTSGLLITTAEQFADRIKSRNLHTRFVNEYMLPYRLTPAAYEFIGPHVQVPDAKTNTDLRPVCYFYDAVLWNKHFRGPQKWVFSRLADLNPGFLWLIFGIGMVVVSGLCFSSPRGSRRVFLFSLFATGFTGLAMEVILLVSFQVYLGYMYGKIGLLIACFMIGMSAGGYAVTRRGRYSRGLLLAYQFLPAIAAAALTLAAGSGMIRGAPPGVLETVFYLLSIGFGFLGGALFVLANGLYLERIENGPPVPVATGYAVDLLGSALGALLVSSMLIPVWGIPATLLLIAAMNAAAILLIVIARFFRMGGNVI
jgi:hypothetical protein